MSEAEAGWRVRIVKVSDESAAVLNHLRERGLVPGRVLRVKESHALDGVVTAKDASGDEHLLGENLARAVFVQGNHTRAPPQAYKSFSARAPAIIFAWSKASSTEAGSIKEASAASEAPCGSPSGARAR